MPDTPQLQTAKVTPAELALIEASRELHIAKVEKDRAYERFTAALDAFKREVEREEGL